MQASHYNNSTDSQRAFELATGSLKDQVVLITGATGGLGTSLSIACARAGAIVVLVSRNQKKLEKLYDLLIESGANKPVLIPVQQDKSGPDDYGKVVDYLDTEFGRLDAVIHCSADLGSPTTQLHIEHAEWVRVMNVNLTSARLLSLYCMPLLMKSPLGSMVFTLDHKPDAFWGAYGVSKQALRSLMHMLADETDSKQGTDKQPLLAINGYDPGPIRTPLRRKAYPGELEGETELPQTRLGPLLSLLARADRSITGAALAY